VQGIGDSGLLEGSSTPISVLKCGSLVRFVNALEWCFVSGGTLLGISMAYDPLEKYERSERI
jgi:hypothetical protein